jgi:peptidoglycan/xylan/chitin deacetylase (PgdA/CDA1 family)
VTRGRLAVHAHFYQPSRLDPWTGRVPAEPSAAPFHDWNQRVAAECYRPNAERGNLGRISWNLGPTLAAWLATDDPATHARFVADSATAIAQAYHHPILPLASAADRRTEIAWGIRDFEVRFGRRPTGLWLPETAVDRATLREAAAQGIAFTILAPWQAAEQVDSRRPYRVDLGDGEGILVFFYDSGLSASVSFEPEATGDADRFARERVATRLGGGPDPLDDPLAVIATDGELYGHHQQFRDLFLQRLLEPEPGAADRGFDVVTLEQVAAASVGHPQHPIRIADRTSWSCHHGVARWGGECPDAADGRWKAPLRAALDRLAGAIDAVTETEVAGLPGDVDPDATRDAYIEVVAGSTSGADFAAARWPGAPDPARARILGLLEAQRWRLAMFASDGWFWDDPIRPETRQVLRAAARAVRLVDGVAGTHLERRLVADLGSVTSPSRGLDGSAIYRMALADIDQPPPAD